MPNFKIIPDCNQISLGEEWTDSSQFRCRERIVDEKGRRVADDYKGRRYQILEKKETPFSTSDRIQRGLFGIIAAISTLCLALLSSYVRKLFTKPNKTIRYAIPYPPPLASPNQQGISPLPSTSEGTVTPFKAGLSPGFPQSFSHELENSETEKIEGDRFRKELQLSSRALQRGISLSNKEIQEIQQCIEKAFQGEKDFFVKFYKREPDQWTFSLFSMPHLIFKMKPQGGRMLDHYQSMIRGETIIRLNQLGLLVVPRAKLLVIGKHEILVEEKLHFEPRSQERYLQGDRSRQLSQLTKLVCEMNYSGVGWHNHPILDDKVDEDRNNKIGLINLRETLGREVGLFGDDSGRKGLIGLVNEEQREIIRIVAKENGVSLASFKAACARINKELEERELEKYYQAKTIVTGSELVKLNESDLDFSTYSPDVEEKLKSLALNLVKYINSSISQSSSQDSIQKRRNVFIDTNSGSSPFWGLDKKLINPGEDEFETANKFETDQEFYDATFFGCVVKKLADLGAIYKLDSRERGTCLQA